MCFLENIGGGKARKIRDLREGAQFWALKRLSQETGRRIEEKVEKRIQGYGVKGGDRLLHQAAQKGK